MNLNNPYGDVIIPRAKLTHPDDSTIIVNPMALDNTYVNHNASLNPYGAYRPGGMSAAHSEGAKDGEGNGYTSNPTDYKGQTAYTLKDDTEEEVGRCRACCLRCRRK